MDIVIFLLLLPSLMCYCDAGENSNKEHNVYGPFEGSVRTPTLRRKTSIDIFGSETEENPNDPKYKEMIEEVVYSHVGFKKENTEKITATKITTQVSATKIKTEFQVDLENGRIMGCRAEVWASLGARANPVIYQCRELDNQEKYIKIAKQSVDEYLKNLTEKHTVVDMLIRNTAIVETRVYKQNVLYVNIDVINRQFNGIESIIKCSVVFDIPHAIWVPLSVHCFEDPIEHYKGADVWADPAESKYLDQASVAASDDRELKKSAYKLALVPDIIVTSVVHKVSWQRNKIEFIARFIDQLPDKLVDVMVVQYKCRSVVWEKSSGDHTERVNCNPHKFCLRDLDVNDKEKVIKDGAFSLLKTSHCEDIASGSVTLLASKAGPSRTFLDTVSYFKAKGKVNTSATCDFFSHLLN